MYRCASVLPVIGLAPRGEDGMVASVEETESSASSTSSGRHSADLPIVGPPRGLFATGLSWRKILFRFFWSYSYYRSCKMRCFCDSKMDQGFFQVSSFQPTRKSPRHMLPKRGPCLARHTSTSAGGSPAADSPPTRKRPAPASGPEAMPPRRSPRLVEDLHCNRPASQGNSSPAKSSARVKA